VGALATPAQAEPTTVSQTSVESFVECATDDNWVFQLSGVGEASGIEAPATITAAMADGTTADFPLDRVTGATDTWEEHSAFYALASTVRPTGAATAEIDDTWDPFDNSFALRSGPCTETELTFSVEATSVVQGEAFGVAGSLVVDGGGALAGREVTFSVTPPNPPTKGGTQFLGTVETDSDGAFSGSFVLKEPGPLTFGVSYGGAETLDGLREHRASASTVVWSLPPGLPPADGSLVSDAGTVVPAGSKITVSASGCGCGPRLDLAIMIYSTPTLLAVTSTDESGSFSSTVRIPEDLSGDHTLVAMVLTEEEELQFLTLPITVTASGGDGPADGKGGGLPVTGGSTLMAAGVGAGLVLLGLGAWVLTRRRAVRFTAD
jgi:LPXTG-motif cell wall-anchored protein